MSSSVRASVIVATLACFLASAVPATAQSQAPPPPRHMGIKALFRDIVIDFAHLPAMENVGPALIGGSAALAAHRVDTDVNRHLYGKGFVHNLFLPGKTIGQSPVEIGAAIVTYVVGRQGKHPRVAHIGLDLLRAQAVTGVLTFSLKGIVRRERPDHSSSGSFPSGHASVTFATASVLARHFGWRAAAPTYLLASYVAASRLHENRHFLSDVVAGSTLGFIVGQTVTRHGRSNFAMLPVIGPNEAGVLFARVW